MKYTFLILLSTAVFACNVVDKKDAGEQTGNHVATDAQSALKDSSRNTTIEWLDPVVQDLGNMQKGQVAEITWKFKNTGNKPLYISNVTAGCGCTTPDVPKEPIAPGAESVIKAKFNSENFTGHVTKDVYVEANNSNRNNGINNKLAFSANIK
ncbi:DUF1573 domain-containing protein [Flavisolibacter sp. BT320]|nr:DUF1573 domain-containing protein [Flavisolibacter longurius]